MAFAVQPDAPPQLVFAWVFVSGNVKKASKIEELRDLTKDEFQLTKKQRAFCDEWLQGRDETEAAIIAGYPRKTAKQKAYALLNSCKAVQEYIAMRTQLATSSFSAIFAQNNLELARSVSTDVTDFFKGNWVPKSIEEIPQPARKLIKKITPTEHGLVLEFKDPEEVQRGLARTFKILSDIKNKQRELDLIESSQDQTVKSTINESNDRRILEELLDLKESDHQ